MQNTHCTHMWYPWIKREIKSLFSLFLSNGKPVPLPLEKKQAKYFIYKCVSKLLVKTRAMVCLYHLSFSILSMIINISIASNEVLYMKWKVVFFTSCCSQTSRQELLSQGNSHLTVHLQIYTAVAKHVSHQTASWIFSESRTCWVSWVTSSVRLAHSVVQSRNVWWTDFM